MIRGTTPRYQFAMPTNYSVENVTKAIAKFTQIDSSDLVFHIEDMTIDALTNSLYIKLTQEQTLSFNANSSVKAIMKVKMNDGDVWQSQEFKIPVTDTTIEEVM